MQDNLELPIGFPLDEERLKREMALAKKEISGTAQTAEQAADRATAGMNELVAAQTTGSKQLEKNMLQLKIQLQSYQAIVEKSFDPDVIELYNRKIAETVQQMKAINGIGGVGGSTEAMPQKRQFDGLQFSMQQIMREMPAFTYSIQTGFMAISNNLPMLADEIGRIRKENEALVASGQKGVPVWRRLVNSLFSWQSAMAIGITLLTVYGKEIGDWIKGLFETRKAIDATKASQDALNESLEGSEVQNAIKNIEELRIAVDLARKGTISKKDAVDRYNETLGKTVGEANDLATVEKFLVDNADAYIQMTLYKAAANLQLAEAAKRAAEIQANAAKEAEEFANTGDEFGAIVKTGGAARLWNAITGGNNTFYEDEMEDAGERRRKAVERQLKKEQDAYTKNANDLMAKAAEYAKQMQIALFGGSGKDDKSGASILNQRHQLLDRLAAIDAEYARKSLTKDEEELQALRDKFAAIRKEVERFNADPKNKNVRIDISGLGAMEDRAVADLTYRQQTEKLAVELDKQAELWTAYEEFKTATSKEQADERYADELDKIRSFRSDLEKQVSGLTMKSITVGLTGGEEERLKALDALLRGIEDKEQANRDARFKKAFADYATFEQRRQQIIAESEKDISALTAAGEYERADERRKARDKALAALSEAYLKSQGDLKKLFDDFDKFGTRGQLNLIKAAKAEFENFKKEFKLSAAELEILNKLFDEYIAKLKQAATGDLAGGITELSHELQGIVTQIGRMDQGLGQALQTIGQMAQSYIKISDIVAKIGDGVQSTGESSGNVWVTAIGAIIELVGTIWSAIAEGRKRRRAAAKAAKEDLANYQAQEIAGEREYQRLLRERELIAARAGKTTYQALIAQLELLKSQAPELQAAYDKIFSSLQGDEFIEGKGYKHGTWFRKAKTWDVMASLFGSDYADLELLYEQGKLKGQTKADFEALRSLRTELEETGISVAELELQLKELLTGTSVDSLGNGLIELFQNGKMAAEDFGKSFEEIMKNAIISGFKYRYLEEYMTPFFDELFALVESGVPEDDAITRLRQKYVKLGEDAADYWKTIEDVTGIDLSSGSPSSSSGMAGSIQNITQQQADVLAGSVGGIHMAVVQGLELNRTRTLTMQEQTGMMRDQVMYQMQIAENTKRTADNTDRLAAMQQHLYNIEKKMSSDAPLRAAGR